MKADDWILPYTKMATKPTGRLTIVTTYDAAGHAEAYHFYGKPDYPRIERETIGQGKLAAIIAPFRAGCLRISSPKLDLHTGTQQDELNLTSHTWYSVTPFAEEAAVLAAIKRLQERQKLLGFIIREMLNSL